MFVRTYMLNFPHLCECRHSSDYTRGISRKSSCSCFGCLGDNVNKLFNGYISFNVRKLDVSLKFVFVVYYVFSWVKSL